jgi:hypothetical protein
MDLAIAISDTDIIHIDQGYLTDARTRQRLRRPGANTTNSDHTDMTGF